MMETVWRYVKMCEGNFSVVMAVGSQLDGMGPSSAELRIIFLKGEADVYTKSGAGESDEPGVFHDRKVYEHTKNDLGVEESVDGKWL